MNPLGITVNPAHPLPLWPHPTATSRQKRANVFLFTCLEGGKTFPAPASWPALLQGVMASNWVWFTLVSSFRHLLQVANICVGRIFPFSLLLSLFFFCSSQMQIFSPGTWWNVAGACGTWQLLQPPNFLFGVATKWRLRNYIIGNWWFACTVLLTRKLSAFFVRGVAHYLDRKNMPTLMSWA